MLSLLITVRKKRPNFLFLLEPLSLKASLFTLFSRAKIRIGYASKVSFDWVLNYATFQIGTLNMPQFFVTHFVFHHGNYVPQSILEVFFSKKSYMCVIL